MNNLSLNVILVIVYLTIQNKYYMPALPKVFNKLPSLAFSQATVSPLDAISRLILRCPATWSDLTSD